MYVLLGVLRLVQSLGRCKYGYLNGAGQGQFCTGAHGASAACRAFRATLSLHFADGTSSNFSTSATSGAWQATTSGNPIRYSHLFHGEIYDANLEGEAGLGDPSSFAPAVAYNTTDRTQTGAPAVPTLHTMPPIAPVGDPFPAVNVTPVRKPGFAGRFIKGSKSVDVFWQANASSHSKHFVEECQMCVCSCVPGQCGGPRAYLRVRVARCGCHVCVRASSTPRHSPH